MKRRTYIKPIPWVQENELVLNILDFVQNVALKTNLIQFTVFQLHLVLFFPIHKIGSEKK